MATLRQGDGPNSEASSSASAPASRNAKFRAGYSFTQPRSMPRFASGSSHLSSVDRQSRPTRSNHNSPQSIPSSANDGYPVRVDPIRFDGRDKDYDKMAQKVIERVYCPRRLSTRMRGYKEGRNTLLIVWKTAKDARAFFKAWHEDDHEDEWADVSVSLDFFV
ncbi:hypothetical protein L218DRAFT_963995 [Marasmius fiardii PR-910]|nr:hypothetical protein L218DRAFT_963995 [Marasmius fiardii PR-910]